MREGKRRLAEPGRRPQEMRQHAGSGSFALDRPVAASHCDASVCLAHTAARSSCLAFCLLNIGVFLFGWPSLAPFSASSALVPCLHPCLQNGVAMKHAGSHACFDQTLHVVHAMLQVHQGW